MADFIMLMHNDCTTDVVDGWSEYLSRLEELGKLRGGSAIGAGGCFRREGQPAAASESIVGFVRVEARDYDEAQSLLAGNPVFDAGGSVEIRELPRTG